MSRIFDALRRAEAERPGADTASLPQDSELLRRAERRVTMKWHATATSAESAVATISDEEANPVRDTGLPDLLRMDSPLSTDVLSAEERSSLLSRFPSQTVSLPSPSRLVCLTETESPAAEALRLLAVRLRDLRRVRPLKKVLITSTIPREGKSLISANLACALARTKEEKVLLVEGDVRLPSLSEMFGLEKLPGICEHIKEEESFPSNIYHLEGAGLWLLPAGSAPNNPLELLQSQRLSLLLEQVSACFDWIIIDSPPILPLADTSIWMRLADGILLVARQGITDKRQLSKGLDALEADKVIGAVLNGTAASSYSGYYYRPSQAS